jgi:hypothetical protein
MPVQDFINRYAMAAGYTNKLSGLAFVPIQGNPAASGTVDWYTCPAGKRAAVLQINYCSPSGSASITPMLKSGGNYYNLNSAQTASAIGVAAGGIVNLIILEAGESISTNQSTSTINVWISIMEYDSDIPYKTSKLLSLASGNNTLYTCPAGKSAIFMLSNLSPIAPQASLTLAINYSNNSGGSRNISVYHVPNGGSPGTSNMLLATTPQAVANGSFLTNQLASNCMNAGDTLVINTDASTATQWAWVNVMEL